jgi:hypothetical protein
MNKTETLFPITFSHSMMQDVWGCELKFFRKHIQRLVRGEIRDSNLIAGGHFAKACEIVRKSYYNDNNSIDFSIQMGYDSILESEDTGDYTKSNERIALSLRKYFQKYPLDDNLTPVKLSNGEHAIEYSFEFDLGIEHPDIPGTNLAYKGKLDGLYERTHHGKRVHVYVVDEKTTGNVYRLQGTKLIDVVKEENQYKTEGQFIGYHWAARQLGVKTHSSLIYKIPIMKEFEPAYCLDIPITEFMIDIWSSTMLNKIEELKDKYLYYKNEDNLPHYSFYAPMTNSACNSWGRNCNFAQGCRSKEGEEILRSEFQQRIYDSASKQDYSIREYKQLKGIE